MQAVLMMFRKRILRDYVRDDMELFSFITSSHEREKPFMPAAKAAKCTVSVGFEFGALQRRVGVS